ncbi:MAG: NAD(P)/FAD-dependent oxidoreductase [Archangiaceae bacterium]|nr:NAD(P)/FAD-dependent oxidoreductase [Archangiaceae bacterium]
MTTRAWGPASPAERWDVIVIGAGVGGLSAAVLLAKLGKRVLVLEQHQVPGGFSQSFRRAHWSWDVGLHVVGEAGHRDLAGRLWSALSGDRLRWTHVDGPWDQAELPGGPRIDYAPGLRERLMQLFPHQRDGLARYFRQLHDAANVMRRCFLARTLAAPTPLAMARTRDVIDACVTDPKLRAALALHWFFYGTPPERSAFGVHALLTRHYRAGAWYPHGGAGSLGRAFATELAASGGWVRTRAEVQEVLVDRGRASGVRLTNGEALRADHVVGAAGALNTWALLPQAERPGGLEALRPALTHLCLHVGFEGELQSAGVTATNRWLIDSLDAVNRVWDPGSSEAPSVYVAFPSLKDPEATRHTAEVVTLSSWEPFARFQVSAWRHRPAEYEALKADISQRLLAVLLARFPRLEGRIAYTELSTPLSNVHFVRAVNGSAYGLESSPERYACRALRPRTALKGLHLAGCDVAVSGITGALAGGISAALSVDPQGASAWLRDAIRTQPKSKRTKGGHHAELAHRSADQR